MPGAVRIPRQMLVLRQDALSRSHTKLVAYDSTDARSMQACTLRPSPQPCHQYSNSIRAYLRLVYDSVLAREGEHVSDADH